MQKALKLLGANAFPQATAEVLNFQAKGSARQAKENVRKRMVVRTQFTIKSTKQDRRAKGNNVDAMFSRVVNNSPYLYKQDEGGNDGKRSVPTIITRKNSFKNKVMRNLRIDKLGKFGKWNGKGERSFFVGRPKGGNRALGIWMRHRKNKRINLVRRLTRSEIKIKPTRFFTDAILVYASQQTLDRKWQNVAKRMLKFK